MLKINNEIENGLGLENPIIYHKINYALTKEEYKELVKWIDKKVSRVELPVKPEIADDSNKIKWFMELAIKMYDTGYCDASIYSIDTDAWDEYRVNDKLTPSQAIAEEESNG